MTQTRSVTPLRDRPVHLSGWTSNDRKYQNILLTLKYGHGSEIRARSQDGLTDCQQYDSDLLLPLTKTDRSYLTFKGRHIPFVNNVKYLCVIYDKIT
jgi:hypothetical protein